MPGIADILDLSAHDPDGSLQPADIADEIDALPVHISLALQAQDAGETYRAQGGLDDLQAYVRLYRLAVEATPDGDPQRSDIINNFGLALLARFRRLESRADLDESIVCWQLVDALTPDDTPDKASWLSEFASFFFDRFDLEGRLRDLEEVISLESRALELTPHNHKERHRRLNNLASSLCTHFQHAGRADSLTKAIALQNQVVETTAKDDPQRAPRLSNLSILLQERFELTGNVEDLEQAIASQDSAVRLTPNDHPDKCSQINYLGHRLLIRFIRLGNMEDIERAIALSDHSVRITPDGHADKPFLLSNLARALQIRFDHNGQLDDLARAITFQRQAVDLTPDTHYNKPSFLSNLGTQLETRFEQSHDPDDLDKAIIAQSSAVKLTPNEDPDKPSHLSNLAYSLRMRFEKTGNSPDLTEAIRCSEQAVDLLPKEHSSRASCLRLLGGHYRTRLKLASVPTHTQSEDLTRAMAAFSEAMQHIFSPPLERFRASAQYAVLSSGFAHLLHTPPPITLLQAYELHLQLIPECVWLGNDVRGRYASKQMPMYGAAASTAAATAIAAGEHVKAFEWLESARTVVWSQILQLRTPLDDLRSRHPKLAADLEHISQELERNTIPTHYPPRPSSLIPTFPDAGASAQRRSSHSYAAEYQKLLTHIRTLQGFESFLKPKTFPQLASACLAGPVVVINTYRSRCDALVLHHSDDRSSVKHIPLPALSHRHATQLRKDLWAVLTTRGLRGRFRDGQHKTSEDRGARIPGKGMRRDTMFKMLADLWLMVVRPIVDFVRTLPKPGDASADELPHITWCPTGPLTFLPLHAAGIYHADGTPPETVMDYAVSSYTPTVEALLKSRPQANHADEYPRVLVVSQPATPNQKRIPQTVVEAETVTSLMGQSAQHLNDAEGTVDAVLEGMTAHNWVHLACHGVQNRENSVESAFILHDGELTLSHLMSRHLPNADLAVLSACQTATGDEHLAEEAVHLAAGMLNVGYKSVIGTMWSIDDEYASTVMETFYKVMLEQVKSGKKLRPAYALHEATKVLRKKCGVNDFVTWIPFVHFGL